MPSDITVIASRWEYNGYPTRTDPVIPPFPNYPYPGGSVYAYLYDYTNGPYDSYRMEVNIDLDRETTDLEDQAIEALKDMLDIADDLFSNEAYQNKIATDGEGRSIAGDEISSVFPNVDFLLTDKTYDNGSVGEMHTRTNPYNGQKDILLEINMDGLIGYMGNPSSDGSTLFPDTNESLMWLGHELGHASDAGILLYDSFSSGGISPTEWLENEQFAWSAGKAILEMAGQSVNYLPQQGYGSDFIITDQQ